MIERCPVTNDQIQIQELGKEGKATLCVVRTRFWTTGVFSSKKAAAAWVAEVCASFDAFMDGAETYTKSLVVPPAGDPALYHLIRNPKRGWNASVKAHKERDAWYALTRLPEYAPPKIVTVREEGETPESATYDDPAFDMKVEPYAGASLDEILEDVKTKGSQA